ncbi:MAG: lamin tail domain-containing protein, partial [Sedimentisphaerales bacterium]|nr:lamin tail domain-containing protein [Sedimentisphaerales bacterium]
MLGSKHALFCALALVLLLACFVKAACPVGDVCFDCEVDYLDVRDLAARWLDPACSAPECRADLDGVAGVDMRDFAKLADNWLVEGTYPLVINEFMASNDGTIEYPEDSGNYPDWFEIYNTGDADIDLAGFWIRDDSHWWQVPTGYP